MDVTSKNIYLKIEPNISDEVKNNLKPDPSLLKKFINKEDINIKTKNLPYYKLLIPKINTYYSRIFFSLY